MRMLFVILLSIGINQLSNAQNLSIDVDSGIVKIGRLSTTFNYSIGSDGRVVCYLSHWSTGTGSDGRKVAYPYGTSNDLEFIFINAKHLVIFEELKSELSEKELINYILYIWINVDKDE